MQRSQHNKKRSVSRFLMGVLGAVVVLGGAYGIGVHHYHSSDKFMPNTVLAGVNVGNSSASEAAAKLDQQLSTRSVKLIDNGKTVQTVKVADTGVKVRVTDSLGALIKKQNAWTWPLQMMNVAQADTPIKTTTGSVNDAKLNTFVKSEVKQLNAGRTPSTNPKMVQLSDGSLSVKKGVQGNTISSKALATNLTKAIANGDQTIDLKQSYAKTSTTNHNQLTKQLAAISTMKANYDINGQTVAIKDSTIMSWLTLSADSTGKQVLTLDNAKVKSYLDKLNDKYASYKSSFTFKSTKQGTITVPGGNFGWLISTDTDATKLANNILTGKDFTQKATITGSGQGLKAGQLGNTYVEVDKKNQHMWFYKNGKLIISTDVVTGLPPKQTTPTGVWFVWNKKRNAVLKGKSNDGSSYASPVKYWMPIDYTGVGLHDAPWQPKFGGDWYKTHGSHGCVNTPPDVMGKLYNAVPAGTPVVVH